jgi:hypothetical protein
MIFWGRAKCLRRYPVVLYENRMDLPQEQGLVGHGVAVANERRDEKTCTTAPRLRRYEARFRPRTDGARLLDKVRSDEIGSPNRFALNALAAAEDRSQSPGDERCMSFDCVGLGWAACPLQPCPLQPRFRQHEAVRGRGPLVLLGPAVRIAMNG